MLGLLLPAVPWRATVEEGQGNGVAVTVTRNGSVVRSAIVDGTRFLGEAAQQQTDADDGEELGANDPAKSNRNVLTAAAAVILTELAVHHRNLQRSA